MKKLYEKLEKLAGKLEKEGKPESSFEIYERLGRVKEEHLQNAVNTAYKHGLYSLGLNICNGYFDGRGKDFFISKVKGVGEGGRFLSIKLSKDFVEEIDPDNKRYDQNPDKIYYKN